MPQVYIVYITAPSGEAESIAEKIIEDRLAACVTVISNVRSVYRWQGAVEHADESLLMVKTTQDTVGRLKTLISTIHSYDVAECIAVPVVDGLEPYLQWVIHATE